MLQTMTGLLKNATRSHTDLGVPDGIEDTVKELLDLLEEEGRCVDSQLFQHQYLKTQFQYHNSMPHSGGLTFEDQRQGNMLLEKNKGESECKHIHVCTLMHICSCKL